MSVSINLARLLKPSRNAKRCSQLPVKPRRPIRQARVDLAQVVRRPDDQHPIIAL